MNQILNYVDKNYESLLIFIENKCIYDLLKIYDDSNYINISEAKGYYLGKTSDEMRGEIKKIIQLVNEKEKYSHNIISLKVKELMIYIAQNDKTNEFRNLLKSCIYEKDNFKKFVEENYDKFKGLQEMAEEYSVSLSVFKRKFKAVFNSAPAKWIRNKKLEKASKLLRLTDYNIIEISHIAGFESVSCFNISFKKKYGVTPSKYRKKD